jgi:hypothetical protein
MSSDIRTALGALKNKNKRVIGGSYQLQRFSQGDRLRRSDGIEGVVTIRKENSAQILWELVRAPGKKIDLAESRPFNAELYVYVKECPPR